MEHAFSWFRAQDQTLVDVLYRDRWVIQAVTRALQPLSQQYVLRCAFIDGEFPISEIRGWCKQHEDPQAHSNSLTELCELGIWTHNADSSAVTFHPTAQRILREILCTPSGSTPTASGGSDLAEASLYGRTQWAAVLDFMVNPSNAKFIEDKHTSWIPGVFVDMELMTCESAGEDTMIWKLTSNGCRYLLEGAEVQMWKLLMAYLQHGAARVSWTDKYEFNQGQLMGLLCMLTFMDAGSVYSLSQLSDCQKEACRKDLRGCGLIFVPPTESQSKPKQICPTPIATGQWDPCAAAASNNKNAGVDQGIIVESNFRVYMYSNSMEQGSIEESLLSLFARIDYSMPQLCCGLFTRNSICAGLEQGIDVDFVVDFLTKHAHPCMMHGTQATVKLPRNVLHQVNLWAKDYNKLDGVAKTIWVGGFGSLLKFKAALKAVKGHLLWHTSFKRDEVNVTEETDWQMVVPDTESVVAKLRACQPGLIFT